jgi:gliding motility-associated-like protein
MRFNMGMNFFYHFSLLLILSGTLQAQFPGAVVTNGSAVDFGGGLIRMTESGKGVQTASVFSTQKLDLTQAFDMSFEMFFGCESGANGGDGMVFVMHNDARGTAALGDGYGHLGYSGFNRITPSVAIEYDTYNGSPSDIADDHTAVLKNGDVLAHYPNPVSIGADLEDCSSLGLQNWVMRMVWNPATKTITQYVNGALKFSYTEDFVSTIFGGTSMVTWGFAGATGNATNEQWIAPVGTIIPWQCKSNSCCVPYTFNIVKPAKICTPGSVTLGLDQVFTKYLWSNGDTTATTTVSASGEYCVSVLQNQGGSNCPGQACIKVEVPSYTITNGAACNLATTLSVAGASSYEWFDAIGGTKVGTGSTFNSPVLVKGAGNKTYYVRDAGLITDMAGGASSGFGTKNYGGIVYYSDAANTTLKFTSAVDLTINSIDVEVNFSPLCANADIVINLKDALGVLIKSVTQNVVCPGVAPFLKIVTIPVNFTLLAGTSYQIDAGGSTKAISCYPSLGIYPTVQNNITLTSSASGARFPAFYNWNISLAHGCYTAVQAVENCAPCVVPANPALSPGDTSLCGSSSQLLTASISNSAAGTYLYTFYKKGTPNILVKAQSINNTYTATSSGVYLVVIGDQADTTNCKASTNDAQLSFNPLPSVDAGNSASICTGESATFSASGAVSYLWNDIVAGAGRTVSPVATKKYKVTGTDFNGCKNMDSVTVTVNPLPLANAGADTSVCRGENAILKASGGETYSWENTSTSSVRTVAPTLTTSYYVTVISDFGCAKKDTVVVTVHPKPTAKIKFDNDTICSGVSLILDASGESGLQYKWSTNSTDSAITVNGTNLYSVDFTSSFGCKASDNVSIVVNTSPLPKVGNDTSFCNGDLVVLSAGINNPSYKYVWYPTLETTSSINVDAAGEYKVSVKDNVGCEGRDTIAVLNVFSLPQVSLGPDTVMCDRNYDKATLFANYSGAGTLNWSTLENDIDSIVITQPGTYWVKITNANQCSFADSIEVVNYCDDCELQFPNVMTPNADGKNDEFTPMHCKNAEGNTIANVKWINFAVYDRWGLPMYSSGNGVLPYWDGIFNDSKASSGTYYFIVKYISLSGKTHEVPGYITLF